MMDKTHENDQFYGWGPAGYGDIEVPDDLAQFYRNVKPGKWAFVCPSCRCIFPPGLAGMPGAFATHVHNEGKPCFLTSGK